MPSEGSRSVDHDFTLVVGRSTDAPDTLYIAPIQHARLFRTVAIYPAKMEPHLVFEQHMSASVVSCIQTLITKAHLCELLAGNPHYAFTYLSADIPPP